MATEPSPSPLDELCAIFPTHPRAQLRRLLEASRNDLQRATLALLSRGGQVEDALVTSSGGAKRRKVGGAQGSLTGWLAAGNAGLAGDEKPKIEREHPPATPSAGGEDRKETDALPSAFAKLRAPRSVALPAPAQAQLPPMTLATPQLVHKLTGGLCTLILDVLPRELAAKLFVRMMDESEGRGESGRKWDVNRWYLFDRQVESPHTTQFYVERDILSHPGQGPPSSGPGFDRAGMEEAAQYWYNGTRRPASTFVPEMESARELVGELVRSVLASRTRHPLEWEGDWRPNVAAANRYAGRNESVGAHSDSLSYLGPYPTIASLSLGVERVFRLRGYHAASHGVSSSLDRPPPPPRTFNIPLPHNSLVIMHAGVQETFKHSVPPVGAGGMDLFKLPRAIAGLEEAYASEGRGSDSRVNLTFRFYRPDFAPLPHSKLDQTPLREGQYAGTPYCACGIPAILRPDGRGVLKSREGKEGEEEEEELARGVKSHFWQCNGGAQNEGRSCGFFRVLDMRAEGRGRWWDPGVAKDTASPNWPKLSGSR